MSKSKNLRSYFVSFFTGIVLILISIFIGLGMFFLINSGFDLSPKETTDYRIGKYSISFGALLFVFFGHASYIIPVFFLIFGFKKIFAIKTNFFLLHFFSFIVSVFFIDFILSVFNSNGGLIGDTLFKFLEKNNTLLLQNKLYFLLMVFLMFFVSIFSGIYGLTLKYRFFYTISYSAWVYFFAFFKIFKIINIFSFHKKINFRLKSENGSRGNLVKSKIKKEPDFQKNEIYKNKKEPSIKQDSPLKDSNKYNLPPLSLLKTSNRERFDSKQILKANQEKAKRLESVLLEYGVEGKIQSFKTGPLITLFEFVPAAGIKNSKIVGLSEDINRAMSSASTRISSQPGKSSIGIEMPNEEKKGVLLGDLLKDSKFQQNNGSLSLALGKDISGESTFADLEKMPHLLIAGTTGSGKSVGINSMILSLLFKFKPSECKFILIDPKMLELSVYEDIPHLLTPVVTNPNKAVFALKWVVNEMENRYRLMSSTGVKNINSFNNKIVETLSKGKKLFREVQTGIDNETRLPIIEKKEIPLEKLPLIVVVIDEMADLMMVAGKEVENLVQRLAQMARASGIHLLTATQRPSVDVITGTIKANFPSRISYRVASRFDSRTIINEMGAEQLLGSGDMLFLENGANLKRLHGGYVSESEIESIVNFINSQSSNVEKLNITNENKKNDDNSFNFSENKNVDELYEQAVSIVLEKQKVSTSFVQRYLQIGYNRAARIVEKMEKDGLISEPNNAGKRDVLKK